LAQGLARRLRGLFLVLGLLGRRRLADQLAVLEIGTLLYFAFFLLMPWWSSAGRFKPVPERVTFRAH